MQVRSKASYLLQSSASKWFIYAYFLTWKVLLCLVMILQNFTDMVWVVTLLVDWSLEAVVPIQGPLFPNRISAPIPICWNRGSLMSGSTCGRNTKLRAYRQNSWVIESRIHTWSLILSIMVHLSYSLCLKFIFFVCIWMKLAFAFMIKGSSILYC